MIRFRNYINLSEIIVTSYKLINMTNVVLPWSTTQLSMAQ